MRRSALALSASRVNNQGTLMIDMASWVQAIGSILAIVVSVMIVVFQSRLQRKSDIKKSAASNQEYLEAVVYLMKHIFSLLENAKCKISDRESRSDFYYSYYESEYKHAIKSLRKINEFEIPNKKLIINFIEFKWLVERGVDHIKWTKMQFHEYSPKEDELEDLEGPTEALGSLVTCVKDAKDHLDSFESELKKYVAM